MKSSLLFFHLIFLRPIYAFVTDCHFRRAESRSITFLRSSALPDVQNMRLREIQAELRDLGIEYHDCFDKESLQARLKDAREGNVKAKTPTVEWDDSKREESTTSQTKPSESSPVGFDAESALADLRSKTLKELKTECSQRNLRYATFLEKEDFVNAILHDMRQVAGFSASGALRPGKASEVTGDQLDQELAFGDTPILLDVYATWCGPCQLMAPELEKAAEELGSRCRVAKLDSDKFSMWAGRYEVQGLPTVLVIKGGEVVERVEGAMMKDSLVKLAQSHTS